MYAVIKAGGKQQKVKPGDVIEIELVHGTEQGEAITFTPILVVDDEGKTHFGKDLGKAVVKGKLLGEEKGEKVKIFKYRPKTGYSRRQGHRQTYTLVEIEDVALAKRASPRKAKQEQEAPTQPEPGEAVEPHAEAAEPHAEAQGEPSEAPEPSEAAEPIEAPQPIEAPEPSGVTPEAE
jgi:large subunit ribosomal protein L21